MDEQNHNTDEAINDNGQPERNDSTTALMATDESPATPVAAIAVIEIPPAGQSAELEVIGGFTVHPLASRFPLIDGKDFDDLVEAAARETRNLVALKNDGPEFYDIARKSRERTVMQSPCENPRLIFWRRPVDTKEMRYCFVMRTAVTTLTLLATLFHFTVGCCGGMHADSGHVDSHADAVAICEHGCDHGGDHAAEAAAEPGMADHLMPSLHDGDGGCPGHDCHGCSCSATHDERPLDSHAVDFLTVAWVGPAIAMIQSAVSVAWEAADPPVRATIAPPLSERLLV